MAELDVKLDTKIKMNFENLVKVDEKLQQLIDILKQNKTTNISQLCSDWWELTDEEDYTIAKFEKALIKDENQQQGDQGNQLKLQLRHMMVLEILSIAVVNYYTSSPDILKPSNQQVQSVKNLLNFIQ